MSQGQNASYFIACWISAKIVFTLVFLYRKFTSKFLKTKDHQCVRLVSSLHYSEYDAIGYRLRVVNTSYWTFMYTIIFPRSDFPLFCITSCNMELILDLSVRNYCVNFVSVLGLQLKTTAFSIMPYWGCPFRDRFVCLKDRPFSSGNMHQHKHTLVYEDEDWSTN